MSATLQLLQQELGERIRENEPLSAHTSFKAGGPAAFYIDLDQKEELIKTVRLAKRLSLPLCVIGGGTNALFSERGFDGLVIKNNCRKIETMRMRGRIQQGTLAMDSVLVTAESGVITNQLVRQTLDEGMSGLEYALGLPGTVGGAVFMNANYPKRNELFGTSMHSAQIITSDGTLRTVDAENFAFSFDSSALQRREDILVSATFRLVPSTKEVVWEKGQEASTYRMETQPRGHISGYTYRNIGIIEPFQRPIGEKHSIETLMEKAGLTGRQMGKAKLFEDNPRYILNMGEASATDAERLIKEVKDTIYRQFGVQLHMNAHVVSG